MSVNLRSPRHVRRGERRLVYISWGNSRLAHDSLRGGRTTSRGAVRRGGAGRELTSAQEASGRAAPVVSASGGTEAAATAGWRTRSHPSGPARGTASGPLDAA